MKALYDPLPDNERSWMRLYEKSLNRRVEVEELLFDMARGKVPLPTQEQCREMAIKLGVPNRQEIQDGKAD